MRNKRDFGDSSRKELEKELRHHAGITDSGSCYYYYYYYYYYYCTTVNYCAVTGLIVPTGQRIGQ
jgi:hypothetical protein